MTQREPLVRRLGFLSRRTLMANLERETQARLKAEASVERQSEYIGQLPYPSDVWQLEQEVEHLRAALVDIAGRPTVERNPDGDDQAAATMQLIAKEALET